MLKLDFLFLPFVDCLIIRHHRRRHLKISLSRLLILLAVIVDLVVGSSSLVTMVDNLQRFIVVISFSTQISELVCSLSDVSRI